MKIKVSETTKLQLDWLVAKCEGWIWEPESARPAFFRRLVGTVPQYLMRPYDYSTDPAQGQPILERERIELTFDYNGPAILWEAKKYAFDGTLLWNEYGPTMLIAGLRCYVASKLGDEVEIPEELS